MLFLIPLFPFAGFLLNAVVGRRVSKSLSGTIGCTVVFFALAVSVLAVWPLVFGPMPAGRSLEQTAYTWIASGTFSAPVTLRLDSLSAVMILVVTGIGFLIHVYSLGYMHEETEAEFARYFAYLNLFIAFMLVLVLGANFLILFVGWEGVGLASYLLIGFWYEKPSAAVAGKKAFVVNRVGDYAFLLGILLATVHFGTIDFQRIAELVAPLPPESSVGFLSVLAFLLFIGATGKSAQIPLHVWLPDAMEGPTPVSALMHAATMVTAGVYMIGRNAELFSHAPIMMAVVAGTGAVTAFFAATIATVQNDIKRVLAYSTISQIGYMVLAMGVGAFAAGIFHLMTHAFFKATLFLAAGAVIHAIGGEQDMRRMGGLRRHLRLTYWTFFAGALALAGVPLFSGFFSKDEILFRTFTGGHLSLWMLGTATSLLTGIYIFRALFMTFHSAGRNISPEEHLEVMHDSHTAPHDPPRSMAIPLALLALGAVLAGFLGLPPALGGTNAIEHFLDPSLHPGAHAAGEATELPLQFTLLTASAVVALTGVGFGTLLFLRRPHLADAIRARFAGAYRVLANRYYVDELYEALLVGPIRRLASTTLWRGIDIRLVDGAVNGTGVMVQAAADTLRRFQSGVVRIYAGAFIAGVVLVLGVLLWGWAR